MLFERHNAPITKPQLITPVYDSAAAVLMLLLLLLLRFTTIATMLMASHIGPIMKPLITTNTTIHHAAATAATHHYSANADRQPHWPDHEATDEYARANVVVWRCCDCHHNVQQHCHTRAWETQRSARAEPQQEHFVCMCGWVG
jgi:hypothetical protein